MGLAEDISVLPVIERVKLVDEIRQSTESERDESLLSSDQISELRRRLKNPSKITYTLEQVEENARSARRRGFRS